MKSLTSLAVLLLLLSPAAHAAEESEPNGTLAQADTIAADVDVQGRVGYTNGTTTDPYDWFRSLPNDDGTLELFVQTTNTSGATSSDFYVDVFNRSSGLLFTRSLLNTAVNTLIRDTIRVWGLAQDTVFFRVRSSGSYDYALRYRMLLPPTAADPEPNGALAASVVVEEGDLTEGRIGYTNGTTTDPYDWYVTLPDDDGTLELFVQTTNTSNRDWSDFYVDVFNRSSGLLLTRSLLNTAVDTTIQDTIRVWGLARDTIYYRVRSSGSYGYSFRYVTQPSAVDSDPEPNGTLEAAAQISPTISQSGRIGYTNGTTTDPYDWFRSLPNDDGTLELFVQTTNTSNRDWSDFYVDVFNRSSGLLLTRSLLKTAVDTTIQDTIRVWGLARDTVFFRVRSSGSYDYALRYVTVPPAVPTDPEPNGSRQTAASLAPTASQAGRIGYTNGTTTDPYDWFGTLMTDAGTLLTVIEATNTSNRDWSDFYVDVFNRSGGLLLTRSYLNTAVDTTFRDTLRIDGLAQDSIFYRVRSLGSYAYVLSDQVDRVTSAERTDPAALFRLYPNPTRDVVYVDLAPDARGARLEVRDVTGRTVTTLTPTASGPVRLDVQGLAPGVYWVRMTTPAGETYGRRLVRR
ncbi:MAG: T9SS type A sorting domain-containing protein [Catalinimonas sp.]